MAEHSAEKDAAYGTCRGCGARKRLRGDGTVKSHLIDGLTCTGAFRQPNETGDCPICGSALRIDRCCRWAPKTRVNPPGEGRA